MRHRSDVGRMLAVSSGVLLVLTSLGRPATPRAADGGGRTHTRSETAAYGRLPLAFEANQGQAPSSVRFVARGRGYAVGLTAHEALVQLRGSTVRLEMSDATAIGELTASETLPGVSNYLIGRDPRAWYTGVATYARVSQRSVWPGIDLTYYGNQQQLEFDFIVAPQADPSRIAMRVHGAAADSASQGDLVLRLDDGSEGLRLRQPVAYQEKAGARQPVDVRFVQHADGRIGFALGAYDRALPLVIDPILSYSTLVGGAGYDIGADIAVDASGAAYITGYTVSANFPTANATQPAKAGDYDAFVAKLDSTGSSLVYSTFLGGPYFDSGSGIAVDGAGQAYVTGTTYSTDFPTTEGAFSRECLGVAMFGNELLGCVRDAFVAKLSASGSSLVYSTLLGGTGTEDGAAVALDAAGHAVVVGSTFGAGLFPFPTTPGAFLTTNLGQGYSGFVTKLNDDGSGLDFSTYLAGRLPMQSTSLAQAMDVAIDGAGNIYVGGNGFAGFPTTLGAAQRTYGGGSVSLGDGFVAKLDASGSSLLYSTFLGGSGEDVVTSIALGPSGEVFATGATASSDFPVTAGAFDTTCGSGAPCTTTVRDGFVAQVDTVLGGLLYSTFLGGDADDAGRGIAVDGSGIAYVTGETRSVDFPTVTPLQPLIGQLGYGPNQDAFVAKVDATGASLLYATFLGGDSDEFGSSIALDAAGAAYLTGTTGSGDYPTTAGAFQRTPNLNSAFVSKIDFAAIAVDLRVVLGTSTRVVAGQPFDYIATVTNLGPDPSTGITVTITQPAGVTFGAVSPSQGTCSGTVTITCTIGDLVNRASATVTIGATSTVRGGTITATVTGFGNEPDPDESNNTYAVPAISRGIADVVIGAIANPDPVAVGDLLRFTVTATNLGPDPASNVQLRHHLPGLSGDSVLAFAVSQGTCVPDLHGPVCQLGTLAAGASATLTLTVDPGAAGTLTSSASGSSDSDGAFDPDLTNNLIPLATIVSPPVVTNADLGVTMTVTPEPVDLGDDLAAQVVIANHGPSGATGVVVEIPIGSAPSPSQGACFLVPNAGGAFRCYLGMVASGSQATIGLSLASSLGWTGSLTTTASVHGNVIDPQPANDSAAVTSTVLIDAPGVPSIPGRFVMDPGNVLANFTHGGQSYLSSGTQLVLSDSDINDSTLFSMSYPSAGPGTDLVVSFQVKGNWFVGDGGLFFFAINDGIRAVHVRAVIVDQRTGFAMWAGGENHGFIPHDWGSPTTLRIRFTEAGGGQIVEVDGRPLVPARAYPEPGGRTTRNGPSIDFGTGVQAMVTLEITGLMVEPSPPLSPLPALGFGSLNTYSAAGTALVAGDFTGDGKLDLAAPGANSSVVTVLPGDGRGSFGAPTQIAVGASPFTRADQAAADFNNDGRPDLATVDRDRHNVSVQLAGNTGALGTPRTFALRALSPIAIAAGDLNGDGKPDLVVSNVLSNLVSVLLGDGAGAFVRASNFPVGGVNPLAIAVADITSDGKLDVIVANAGTGTVGILPGDGFGGLGAPVNIDAKAIPFFTKPLAIGDFDGNGKKDIAVVTTLGVGVLLQDRPPPVTIAVPQGPDILVSGDLNGDGRPDLVVTNGDGRVSALIGSASGVFAAPVSFNGAANPTSVAIGDLNEDGNPDLLFSFDKTYFQIALGHGDGTFAAPEIVEGGVDEAGVKMSSVLADVNDDGHLDAVSAVRIDYPIPHGSYVSIRAGDGTGQLAASVTLPVGGLSPRIVRVARLGEDTMPDVIVANEESRDVGVLVATGPGTFGAPQLYPLAKRPTGLALADLDDDGYLDLVVAHEDESTVSVLRGDGLGEFGTPTSYATGLLPSALSIADVDRDGLLDVVTANGAANTLSILFGNGDGTLGRLTHVPLATRGTAGLVVGKFDSDSKPDAAVANLLDDSISLLLDLNTVAEGGGGQTLVPQAAVTIGGPDTATYGQGDLSVVGGGGSGTGAISFSAGVSTACQVDAVTGALAITSGTGTCAIVATRAGDLSFFPASSQPWTITVSRAASVVTWSAPAGVTYGTPLGAIQLNAVANVPGTMSYVPAAGTVLTAGAGQGLAVAFTPSDDANYTAGAASTTIDVAPAPLSIRANDASTLVGAPLPVFSAAIAGFVNDDTLASLSGTLAFGTTATATSPAGTYTVTPGGVGSPNYLIAFIDGTLTIQAPETATTVTSSVNPSGFGQPVTFTASVVFVPASAGVPTGSVRFSDGGTDLGTVPLTNGAATLTAILAPGQHTIIGTYAGADSASRGTLTQVVRGPLESSVTTLTASSVVSVLGAQVTLTATVLAARTPSGVVRFLDGTMLLATVPLSGPTARLQLRTLGLGVHRLTAVYDGDAAFAGSTSLPLAHTVYQGATPRLSTTRVRTSPNPSAWGAGVVVTAIVETRDVPAGRVEFFVDGIFAGSAALSGVGQNSANASITLASLPRGAHTVTGFFTGGPGVAGSAGFMLQVVY